MRRFAPKSPEGDLHLIRFALKSPKGDLHLMAETLKFVKRLKHGHQHAFWSQQRTDTLCQEIAS